MSQNLAVSVVGIRGTSQSYNITTPTVVKAAPGTLVRVSVVVAGTTAGEVNDCTTVAAVSTANLIAVIPNTVGQIPLEWPLRSGLVVTPGTGQTVAVSFA